MIQWAGLPIRVPPFRFFDIETTGLRPDRGARITEVAVVDQTSVRFDWTREQGGIGDSAWPQMLRILFDHLRTGVVVGHNLRFDFRFITYEAERHGYAVPPLRFIDTLGLARALIGKPRLPGEVEDYRLETLLQAFGIPAEGTLHTAVADARATRALFWKMVERGGLETLADAGLKRLSWTIS